MAWRIAKKVIILLVIIGISIVVCGWDLQRVFNTDHGVGFLNKLRTVIIVLAISFSGFELLGTVLSEVEDVKLKHVREKIEDEKRGTEDH